MLASRNGSFTTSGFVSEHREVFRADVAVRPLRPWDGVQTVRVEACMQELAHWLYRLRGRNRLRPQRVVGLPPRCSRKPAIRRAASSAERPHMPRPPSPPALLTGQCRCADAAHWGAWMIGHFTRRRCVRALLGHNASLPLRSARLYLGQQGSSMPRLSALDVCGDPS